MKRQLALLQRRRLDAVPVGTERLEYGRRYGRRVGR